MPGTGTFETWRTGRDGPRWIASPARSTGTFETWLNLRGAPLVLASIPAQSLAARGISTSERIGTGSLGIVVVQQGSLTSHILSDWPRIRHAVSDAG